MGLLRRLYAGLRLRVNESRSAVDRPQNRKLCGDSFYRGRRGEGVKRRVAPKALEAMTDRVRELTRPTRSPSIARVAADLRSYLTGWKNDFRLADTPKVFAELDEWIRHRLRALHLRHWKRGRVTYRELRARGLPERAAAYVAANTRRWWKNSAMLISVAFPIRYFDESGVPRLAA
jgi:RNA-directed DNA polymerase